ncbi:MAG: dihydropteroate synthase [Pseudomonadota bacterium]
MKFKDTELTFDRPRIMGVLNITPDSFSDGGRWYRDHDRALLQVEQMLRDGADIIDIGGESTRPGAEPVNAGEELERVIPLVEAVASRFDCVISVDTSKPEVMAESVRSGAGLINDVRALREEGALETAAALDVPVCLMHMQGQPRSMQANPEYADVVADVIDFLARRRAACLDAGIGDDRLILDPGFGFGKTLHHNCRLFAHLPTLVAEGLPVLVGVSRKRMIGELTGQDVDHRVVGSSVAAGLAAACGAHILRVHDVSATRDAIAVSLALTRGEPTFEA